MSPSPAPHFPPWFWLLWLTMTGAFFGFMHSTERGALPDVQWQIDRVDVLFSDADYPPAAAAPWQDIALPFTTDPDGEGPVVAWLRFTVPAKVASESLTLAIPSPNFSRYALWYDNREIDQRGMQSDTVSLLRHPIAFSIPPRPVLGSEPTATVMLRINSQDPSAYWQPMVLGPTKELQDYVSNAQFTQQTLVRTIMAMMAVMSFLMAIIHRMRFRKETAYGWYALGMFTWLLHTGQGQLQSAPFASLSFWIALGYVTLPTFVVVAAIFTNRVINRPQPRVERWLLAGLTLGAGYIFYRGGTDGSLGGFLTLFWIPATIAVGTYNVTCMVRAARREYAPDVLILLAATAVVLVVGIRDYLYNNLGLIPGTTLYLKYAAGLVLVVFSFVLMRRFSNALTQAEQANLALQAKRPLVAPESGADYRRVVLAEHHLLEEQIDQLLDNVASTEELESVRRSLHAAKHDMQLITDALSTSDHPAEHLLASLQQRLEIQARQYQTDMQWHAEAADIGTTLQSHQLLSLGRFIQISSREAFEAEAAVKIVLQDTGTEHRYTLTAAGIQDPEQVFKRRLQYQRMAAELTGQASYREVGGNSEISLSWRPPDALG